MEPEKIRASAAVSSFDSSVSHKSLLPFTARISSGILSFAPLYAHARCTHFSPLVRRPEVTAAAAGGLGAPRSLPASPPPPMPPAGSPGPSGAVRKARCGCAAEFRSGELQYPADRGASSGVPGNASPPRMARRFGPSAPRAGRVVPVCAPRPGGAAPAFPRSASLGAGRAEAAAGP